MAECYKVNHNPKYCFVEPIQTFKLRDDLPPEPYELDILDGSPPCSSFSMAGNRGDDWGKEKKFREGQAEQVLDTLFFDFIDLAAKLQPKVVVAENVKGLLLGEAKAYVNDILIAFNDAGYFVDYKLLDASDFGVPQGRERVFFFAVRKDCYAGMFCDLFNSQPDINMAVKESKILFGQVADGKGRPLTPLYHSRWEKRVDTDMNFGDITERLDGKAKCFSDVLHHYDRVAWTVTSGSHMIDFETGLHLSDQCLCQLGSFPLDYNFLENKAQYVIGMSVPPVMMAHIASLVKEQWL